ncbi:S4 domain-containing protein [Methyloversatilis thermotolerans]|uniref:S4 domain-containing protein n=1 Tax=Methyloversatilis thermotolerans TaxID=1346290 RepID=UPI000376EEFA|nr:S4 domain-containing protein [Methyloversatilis thermotolerans]
MKSFHRRAARPAPSSSAAPPAVPDRRGRVRIDTLLVERGLAVSRAAAQRLVDSGVVLADGRAAARASLMVAPDCCVTLRAHD